MSATPDALGWLAQRAHDVPDRLQRRMREAIAASRGRDVATVLGNAAVACLCRAAAQPEQRSAAVDLLSADALLTHGCEAAALDGTDSLRAFCREFGIEALTDSLAAR
ncbi:MAG: hypothetical protein ACRELD_00775 [Longimicrobiales bacterium]